MTKTNPKGSFSETLRENYRALTTLVKMQLKEKLDLSFVTSPKKFFFKLIWLILEFSAITAIIYVAFYFIKLLGLFSFIMDIPVSVVSVIFGLMLGLSLVTDTLGLMKSLYFSKDNTVLLTFPATPSLIFFSKLVTYYVYEIRRSFMFTIPMFIAYGLVKGYSAFYYPWLILMFVLISIVPVLLAALLSIPAMFVKIFLNRVKAIQYIIYTVAVGGGIALLWYLIYLIPKNINFMETWGDTYWEIQAFLTGYTKTFAPIYMFTELIVGKTIGLESVIFHSDTLISLLTLIITGVVLLVLCFVCSKPLFCRMAATPFEFKKNNSIKEKNNKKFSPFVSALKKEFIVGLRSNTFLTLGGILVVVMPMAIFLLNKLYSAMNTKYLGAQMSICFNILIILLIMLMTNIDIASVYSRDGSSSYLNKVQPAPFVTLLISKLVFPASIAFVGLSLTVVIFSIVSKLGIVDAIMIGITLYSLYVAHLFISAENDIMNPQHDQYATFTEQTSNPNESSSGLAAIIIAFVVFVIGLFLSSRGDNTTWIKLGIVALAFAAYKVYTYLSKIKAFYKEK